ncbi:MAG: L,D-transpeptidase [Planctomycetota bacterium]|nr:L,D-transpeptidase [Planctomycetota bacterium]
MRGILLPALCAGLLAFSGAASAEAPIPSNPDGLLTWLFGTQRAERPFTAAGGRQTSVFERMTVTRTAPTPAQQAFRSTAIDPRYLPRLVPIETKHPAGTIIVDTRIRYLFLVLKNGQAMRYGIGVGRPGFEWAGTHKVSRKAEWPGWTPPAAMRRRQPGLPAYMEGGLANPLGARALYLGSTLYRIHGSNEPWTIGQAVSSGCIRMRNEDVIELYKRVRVGARVIVI